MSSKFCVIGAILFVCGSCYAQAPTSDVQVPSITNTNSSMKLEDSTPVMLRTKQDLSSATVKVGDRVPFRVVKDVRVADLIVIPRGADAWGPRYCGSTQEAQGTAWQLGYRDSVRPTFDWRKRSSAGGATLGREKPGRGYDGR